MIINQYLSVSIQYYNASLLLCNEIIKSANNSIIVSSNINDIKQNNDKYYDFDLILPLLFNFYHAIELFLKGVIKNKQVEFIKDHKITDIYNDSKKLYENEIDLNMFSKYLNITIETPELINIFFSQLCLSVDQYYEILRYPENKKK